MIAQAVEPHLSTKQLTKLETLVKAFRLMYTSRRIDDREILLKRQNRILFPSQRGRARGFSGSGRPCAKTWVRLDLSLLPRSRAFASIGHYTAGYVVPSCRRGCRFRIRRPPKCLRTGAIPRATLLALPPRPARSICKPSGARKLAAISIQNPTVLRSSAPVKAPLARASFGKRLAPPRCAACPSFFLIQDNGYAISVPADYQTPGGNISRLLSGFPDLWIREVDGTDFAASFALLNEAVEHCRSGQGPAFIHGHLVRLYSHSLSDMERIIKPQPSAKRNLPEIPFPRFRNSF